MSEGVRLMKGANGLGIALQTTVVSDCVWTIVHSLRPGSEAAKCGLVRIGSRVEAVNGFHVVGKTHHFVKDLLQLVPQDSLVELKLLEPIGEDSYDDSSNAPVFSPSRLFPVHSVASSTSFTGLLPLQSPHSAPGHVRRSQSDCYSKARPQHYTNLSRVQSVHSKNPWEAAGSGPSKLRQSMDVMSSSGLGDSIGSLSSLYRQDTSERWPESGHYAATGTDLHRAVVAGDTGEVERLLKIGSSVYSLDSEGDTPLDLASRAGNIAILKLMEELYEGSTASTSSNCSLRGSLGESKLKHKKSRHRADIRKELAKAYENIGSKV